jgi:predicted small secreted protein
MKKEGQAMKKALLIIVAVFVSGMMTASAGFGDDVKYSGFLGSYRHLKPGPEGGVEKRYIKEGVDFSKYNKLMLDGVVFYLADDAQYKGINAEEVKELSDTFNKAVVDAIGKDYPLVSEPGPDVLRIRVAITNLEPADPGKSVLTTVTPIGLGLSLLKKGATGSYPGVGKTGMEAELLDSLTNEQVGAAVDRKGGSKLSGTTRWGSAKEAFEFWAGRLKVFMDSTRSKASGTK